MLSVITPVLNGAAFIEKNIQSVASLKIPFEHIIVDGGSTDGTIDIIEKYHHITLVNQSEKSGMYGAINEGIRRSKGEIIGYLNADDVYLPGIEVLYHVISDEGASLVYGDTYFDFAKEHRIADAIAAPNGEFFLKQGVFPCCQSSSLFSRKVYDHVGGFRYKDFKVCGDLDLYQRIAYSHLASIIYRPVFASIFLKYGESLGDKSLHLYQKEWKLLLKYTDNLFLMKAMHKIARLFSKYFISHSGAIPTGTYQVQG